ncbi:hypothetical protein H8E88_08405 [candidate division KSB1 bacterium]|nr:hypothetical protein [candidate division KSB1 bacterium]
MVKAISPSIALILGLAQNTTVNTLTEKTLATNHLPKKPFEPDSSLLFSFKNKIVKRARDWLADSRKSTKPKTSTNNLNKQSTH